MVCYFSISHVGSIWGLSWCHPRYGTLIASGGFDKRIQIHKYSKNILEKFYEYRDHKNSVNTVAFYPNEDSLLLLAGSSDGNLSIHDYKSILLLIER